MKFATQISPLLNYITHIFQCFQSFTIANPFVGDNAAVTIGENIELTYKFWSEPGMVRILVRCYVPLILVSKNGPV